MRHHARSPSASAGTSHSARPRDQARSPAGPTPARHAQGVAGDRVVPVEPYGPQAAGLRWRRGRRRTTRRGAGRRAAERSRDPASPRRRRDRCRTGSARPGTAAARTRRRAAAGCRHRAGRGARRRSGPHRRPAPPPSGATGDRSAAGRARRSRTSWCCTVTSASGLRAATMASAASTCAVRRLSSTQKASANASRRPGGCAPSIQPLCMRTLGSLTVTQRRQWGARDGITRCDVAGEAVRRPGAQPELLSQPGRVGEVVQGDIGLQATRRAQLEDLDVAGQGGVVEAPRLGLQPGPFDREAKRVAADGGRPVQRLLGVGPEIARRTGALHPSRTLPGGPVVGRLAAAVVAAFDLIAGGGHPDGETVPQHRGRRAPRAPRARRGEGTAESAATSHSLAGHTGRGRPRSPVGVRARERGESLGAVAPATVGPTAEGEHMADEVLRERRGHVEILTINRPEARNAINGAVSPGLLVVHGRADR